MNKESAEPKTIKEPRISKGTLNAFSNFAYFESFIKFSSKELLCF